MTPARDWPVCIGGDWVETRTPLPVIRPWDAGEAGRTWVGGAAELERATAAAVEAAPVMARLPAHERASILRRVSAALADGRDAIARTLAAEAGKPLKDARTEVDRASLTFSIAADESLRIGGEQLPLDVAPHGVGRVAVTRRVPAGPVAGISPFNFPLNLVAHKLAPAIAAGNPVVLKPATKTPLSALTLARLLVDAGVPPGSVSVLPLDRRTSDTLVTDPRFRVLTFTGSSAVGWDLKARAGHKRVLLELGGNAGVIVDRGAAVDFAARRLTAGGFGYAGQSCISVQRVYAHADVFDDLRDRLAAAAAALVVGDPLDEATDVGPLITGDDAARIDEWVREAVSAGATVVTGGTRIGRSAYAPTVLTGVPPALRVCAEEAFAPVVVLERFTDFDAALGAVNASRYGLQAGVFTPDLAHALAAFDRLEVGGVIVNDVPSWRIDHMPYGGVKSSGLGREGPRYAIEEMTELRLLVVNQEPA